MLEKEWAAIVYNKSAAEFAVALTGKTEVAADTVALNAFQLAQIGFGIIAMTDEWPDSEWLGPMPVEVEGAAKITAAKEVYNFFVENYAQVMAKGGDPTAAVFLLAPYAYVFGVACVKEGHDTLPQIYLQANMHLDGYLQTQQGRQRFVSFDDALTKYNTVRFKPSKRLPGNEPD